MPTEFVDALFLSGQEGCSRDLLGERGPVYLELATVHVNARVQELRHVVFDAFD